MKRHVAVIGAQWGDEGKGKVVDALVPEFDVIVRYQGGTNAGHTIVVGDNTYKMHLLPAGALHKDKISLIGDGVVVDPLILVDEMQELVGDGVTLGKVLISNRAHLIMPWHRLRDSIAGGKVGTTGRGIGPTYTDAVNRRGIRVCDWLSKDVFVERVKTEVGWNRLLIEAMAKQYRLSASDIEEVSADAALNADEVIQRSLDALDSLMDMGVEFVDGSVYLDELNRDGKRMLFEGAQGTMLDITYGTYPFVTSSHPSPGGMIAGTGFVPEELDVIGIVKAYTTRVGNGPFPTELTDELGEHLREHGSEYGATTGRPRRCGWLDLEIVRHAVRVNGLTMIGLTKLDILSGMKQLKAGAGYSLNGETISGMPALWGEYEKVGVDYKSIVAWEDDITEARSFEELPTEAQNYVQYIEDMLEVPVRYIGVGPEREQLIERE